MRRLISDLLDRIAQRLDLGVNWANLTGDDDD